MHYFGFLLGYFSEPKTAPNLFFYEREKEHGGAQNRNGFPFFEEGGEDGVK